MSNFAIQIKDLKKTYQTKDGKGKEALKSINLEVKKGSFFGLLGPNGAGKSTIINIMAGLTNKSSGKVAICGHDLDTHPKEAKYKIGIVPQELIIDPFFNVFETLEIYAGYFGIKKQNRRTLEIVEALGLKDRLKDLPRSLSGGMKRRLLVAKALVHSPELLVLDEPTAGVDVELRTRLWEYVKKLNKEDKTTILLTTHYLEEAQELCDELAIINEGLVVASGNKQDLIKTLDSKQLEIVSKNKISKIPDCLNKGLHLEANLVDQNRLIINYKSKETNIDDILSILQGSKIKIADISTSQADLEDVFKFLIKK